MRYPSRDVRTWCCSAAALSAALIAATTTTANAGSVGKFVPYNCDVQTDKGPDLGNRHLDARLTVPWPGSVAPGQRLGAGKVKAAWKMSEAMRQTWLDYDGVAYKGRSSDTRIKISGSGSMKVKDLRAPKAKIPQGADAKWNVHGKGRIGSFTVPRSSKVGDRLELTMPRRFTFHGTMYGELGSEIPHLLTCSSTGKRAMGAISIAKATPKLRAKVKPKRIVAGKTHAKAYVTVKVPAGVKAKAKIKVTLKGRTLGKAKGGDGTTTIKLKRIAKPGKKKLKITYTGTKAVKHKTITKKVHVVKR